MNLLFASLEVAPLVKVGGIADMVAALGKALVAAGHRVTVAVPRQPGMDAQTRLPSGVDVVGLDVPGFTGGAYGEDVAADPAAARPYGELARAIVALAETRLHDGAAFDVVHAHDWPVALALHLLRAPRKQPLATRGVLTVHNIGFQGAFPREALGHLGLHASDGGDARLGYRGGINLLKGGLLAADAVTTVSPAYAREMKDPRVAFGLERVLAMRGIQVRGITNGIDTEVWDPRSDPALAARFGADDLEPRAQCREALRAGVGLRGDAARPLVVFVGRIFAEKGAIELAAALGPLVARGADVVIAGTGDAALVAQLGEAGRAAGEAHVKVRGFVPEAEVHRMFAGADFALVPSRVEPCGLVQMYAQRYGALPIARRTGGLADTVADGADGWLYDGDADALVAAFDRARALWTGDRAAHVSMQERAMLLDRSWERGAREYEKVYRSARVR